jgi:hypothetical protein
MGQFSWITQDTRETIRERYGCSDTSLTTAYMHDNKGNVWEEHNYEGYGVFGGKDYYQLLAEMSRPDQVTGDVEHDRTLGIELAFGERAIKHVESGKILMYGRDFKNWNDPIVDDLSANDLSSHIKWESIHIIPENVLYPNLTREESWTWRNQEPEGDPNQGWGEYEEDEDYWDD